MYSGTNHVEIGPKLAEIVKKCMNCVKECVNTACPCQAGSKPVPTIPKIPQTDLTCLRNQCYGQTNRHMDANIS